MTDQNLSEAKRRWFEPVSAIVIALATALPVIAAGVAVALHEIVVAALLAAIVGLLLVKANLLSRTL